VAWAYEFVVGHYLEFLKIVKQTKPGTYWQLTKVRSSNKKGHSVDCTPAVSFLRASATFSEADNVDG